MTTQRITGGTFSIGGKPLGSFDSATFEREDVPELPPPPTPATKVSFTCTVDADSVKDIFTSLFRASRKMRR